MIKKINLLAKLFQYSNSILIIGLFITIFGSLIKLNNDLNMKKFTLILISIQILIGTIIGISNLIKKNKLEFIISSVILLFIITPIITIQMQNGIFNISILHYLILPITQDEIITGYLLRITTNFTSLIIPAIIITSLNLIFEKNK